jgi:hypothetical protein
MKVLINNNSSELGYYTVAFDGNGFASGIIICLLTVGNFIHIWKTVHTRLFGGY